MTDFLDIAVFGISAFLFILGIIESNKSYEEDENRLKQIEKDISNLKTEIQNLKDSHQSVAS